MKAVDRRTGLLLHGFYFSSKEDSIMKNISVRRLTITAMLMAMGMLLPFLTGQIQHFGNMLLPMHLPVFICGMICGPVWGLITGALLPLVRSMVFGMPVLMPAALAMAFMAV